MKIQLPENWREIAGILTEGSTFQLDQESGKWIWNVSFSPSDKRKLSGPFNTEDEAKKWMDKNQKYASDTAEYMKTHKEVK